MYINRSRKYKLILIAVLVVVSVSLSIGFAAFSVSLNISSSASVTPNASSFSVKFSSERDSVVLGDIKPSNKSEGISTGNAFIYNTITPTVSGLSASFTEPGQFVEYTFYVRNEGDYNAYLNNVLYIGEKTCKPGSGTSDYLAQSSCEDIHIIITIGDETYYSSSEVTEHLLSKKSYEIIKVKLVYSDEAAYVDGVFSVVFPEIALSYSTVDDTSMTVKSIRVLSGSIDEIGSEVAIDTEHFYVYGQENGNVKLLSKYNLLVGNKYNVEDDIVTPLNITTGRQDLLAIGYFRGNSAVNQLIGTVPFSNDAYWDYDGDVYNSNSNLYGYLENYEVYLRNFGISGINVRLMSYQELVTLGCNLSGNICTNAPSWVYSTTYWTSTGTSDGKVWNVISNGYAYADLYNCNRRGVRPVVEIPIVEFIK